MRGVHTDLRFCQEEIFGPVAAVIPFRDDAHAVELANGTRDGLAAGVWDASTSIACASIRA